MFLDFVSPLYPHEFFLGIRNTTWCVEKLVSVVSKETTPQLSKKETYLSNTVLDQHVFEQPTSGGDPYMNSDYFKVS
jgi:hypothetical protein